MHRMHLFSCTSELLNGDYTRGLVFDGMRMHVCAFRYSREVDSIQ